MNKPSKKREATGPGRPATGGYPAVPPISVRLPLAYMQILETEANLVGARRGDFLQQLLLRKNKQLVLERPPKAPKYPPFDKKALTDSKVFNWYIKPTLRKLLAEDRLKMGNLPTNAWVVTVLNQWIGSPEGISTKT